MIICNQLLSSPNFNLLYSRQGQFCMDKCWNRINLLNVLVALIFFPLALFPAAFRPASTMEPGATEETAPDDHQVQSGVPEGNESQASGSSGRQRIENALMELVQKFPQYNEDAVEQSTINLGPGYVHNFYQTFLIVKLLFLHDHEQCCSGGELN